MNRLVLTFMTEQIIFPRNIKQGSSFTTSTSTSTWVICSRNIHFADTCTVKSVCVNQPTQTEHLQLKLNKQTVLYRLKIRFPHYSRYSHKPARNTSVNGAWMMPCGSRFQSDRSWNEAVLIDICWCAYSGEPVLMVLSS